MSFIGTVKLNSMKEVKKILFKQYSQVKTVIVQSQHELPVQMPT